MIKKRTRINQAEHIMRPNSLVSLPLDIDTSSPFSVGLLGFSFLRECRCVPLLDRSRIHNARSLFETIFIDNVKAIYSKKGHFHFASIGSGGLLSEIFLLRLLLSQQFVVISLDLVDASYRDTENKAEYFAEVVGMLRLLYHTWNLHISLAENYQDSNPCQNIFDITRDQLNSAPVKRQANGMIKIGFFGSVDDYVAHRKRCAQQLDMIVSVDFESCEEYFPTAAQQYQAQSEDKEKIFSPLREICPAVPWIDVEKNEAHRCVNVRHR
jgi:hypothetical protein